MSGDAASLPCPLCLNSGFFQTVQSLRDRLISVSTSKIICPVCQEEIFGLDKLTIHLFTHVKLQNNYSCENENANKQVDGPPQIEVNCTGAIKKKIKSPAAKKNTTSNSNEPLKYVRIYPKLSTAHQPAHPYKALSPSENVKEEFCTSPQVGKAVLAAKENNEICNECGLQFVNSYILKMHNCIVHNADEKSIKDSSRHKCHICPKHFKMRGSLMVHLRVAHFGFPSVTSVTYDPNHKIFGSTKSENQDEVLNETELNVAVIDKNDNKHWKCDVCQKSFTTKYFLKKHKRLHTGETPYACSQCNKTFTFQQSYHKHLLYHNDEKPHICNYCGRAFKELSTLHNHQRIHTGEKPFSCETCGKCFRQRVSYLVHRRIHTGVMPYKCTSCNKSFRYKVSQRTHKCQAQPPGTVVRQGGELLEKLKKRQSDLEEVDDNTGYHQVSEANAELVRTGAQLSLEDTVTENFTLLPNSYDHSDNTAAERTTNPYNSQPQNNLDEFISESVISSSTIEKNVPSPSEIMKNLCLSSDDNYSSTTINLQNDANISNYNLFNEFNGFY